MTHNMSARRSFMSGLGAAIAALGLGSAAAAAQTPKPAAGFKPARHRQDDWLDKVPGKHRVFIDAATASGAGEAILFANNLYTANKDAYALGDSDLTIVICLRHFATPFAFTDAMWAKYGKGMSAMVKFTDPRTHEAPSTNLYNSAAYGLELPTLGNTIDAMIKRGTSFAICDAATHFLAAQMAGPTGGNAAAIYKDLTANTIPSSRFVPAGVVAVNRSQERGYTLLYAG